MKIEVYYATNAGHELPVHVATITLHDDWLQAEALERAYELTQNIYGSWSRGPVFEDGTANEDYSSAVEVHAQLPVHSGRTLGHRSTMIGDTFVIKTTDKRHHSFGWPGRAFRVASMGFVEV